MYIQIEKWGENNFGFPVSKNTLIRYGKQGKIKPRPFKFAGKICVDENAKYTPNSIIKVNKTYKDNDPVVQRILNDVAKT